MPVFSLSSQLIFPPPAYAEPDGLLAVGGDLDPDRLLLAYESGIFPWYSPGDPILWWSPDPRFVIIPGQQKVSKSMKQILKRRRFRITINAAFEEVISSCKTISRPGQEGTWITGDMKSAYLRLHELGYAHSAEAWEGEKLVGGLYGVAIGGAFFGESMFSTESNASKAAFLTLAAHLDNLGFGLIDCQVYTKHLESLGALMIPREEFLDRLRTETEKSPLFRTFE